MGSLFKLTGTLNRNSDFLTFREKSLNLILTVCTFGGAAVIIIWHYFDYCRLYENVEKLAFLRAATVSFFIFNWLISRKNLFRIGNKNHLFIGLYIGSVFCMILNAMTGGSLSPNWPGMIFILIAFMIMPFPFHQIILHSFIILLINAIIIANNPGLNLIRFGEVYFLYSGVFIISCLISFIHNEKDARAFMHSKASDEALQRESEINNKLRAEIDLRKQIEQTLDKNRQYLQNILNNAPIITWAVDLDGKFLLSEGKGLKLMNSEPGQNTGKSVFEVYPEDSEVSVFARKMLTGEVEDGYVTFRDITFSVHTSPLLDPDGNKIGVMGIALDVTDTMKAKNELLKYKRVLEQAPGMVSIFDTEGRIEYVNPFYLKVIGIDIEKVIGKTMSECNPEFYTADQYFEIKNTITNGKSLTSLIHHKSKDGQDTWYQTISAPFYDDHNQTQGYLFIDQDITELKNLDLQLKASEEKYRTLVDEARDGILITQDGKFRFVNKAMCDILKYNEKELIGRSFFDFIIPEDHGRLAEYHARRMAGEKYSVLYTTTIIDKNGDHINLELHAKTIDYEGKPAAFIMARDITQRIQAAEELKRAKNDLEKVNKQLEQMLSEQSRELDRTASQLQELHNKNLQTQFEILKSQVNPHFLFNSLNVLSSLIQFEPELAEEFTEQLAKVYRYILENKDKDLIPVRTEIDFLDAYVFLLNIRFKDKLFVDINVEEAALDMYLVPLALQLLMENCIKHNTFSKKSPLIIKIFSDKCCYVTITNNIQMRESHFASTGVGLQNIEKRYALITDNKPEFYRTDNEFIARIPLIETV